MIDYLSEGSQNSKVGVSFTAYLDFAYGEPQGSILGSMLFNRDLCNLFFEDYSFDIVNFADHITAYGCGSTINEVMNTIEITPEKMFEWFNFNNMKTSASK